MNKKILTLLSFLALYSISIAQSSSTFVEPTASPNQLTQTNTLVLTAEGTAIMKFENSSHDFGEIKEGTLATYEFTFTNTGTAPLKIEAVNASCSCTAPEWSKEEIAPGQTGKIVATFNAQGKPGTFNKTIVVKYNGSAENSTEIIILKGTVNAATPPPVSPTVIAPN